MMTEIFKAALVTSLAGGVLTLIIALAHPFTKRRFSAGWNYYVWLAVMVVILCPARISLPHRAREAAQPAPVTVTETDAAATDNAAQVQAAEQTEAVPVNIEPVRATGKPFGMKADDVLNALAYIWVITAAALFAARLTGYALFCRRMRKSSYVTDLPQLARYTKRRVMVRRSGSIASPLIVGVFRPTLLMPDTDLSDDQLHYVLLHETTHLKRGDILYKWLAAVVKCVHWFNPAVYFMAARVNTECEISCDAAVTSGMTRGEETGYIDTILALLSNGKRTVPLTTGMTGGKRVLRRRFTMIKDKRVIGKATRALSACLTVVMTAAVVFAGGVLADGVLGGGNNDDGNVIKYEIYDGDRLIETAHEPFIYNGDYYLPLRETLNGFGCTDISYADGVATVTVPEDEEMSPIPTGTEGSYFRYFSFDANEGSFTSITFGEREMYASNNRPVIVDGVMYAPIESFMAIMQYYSSFADFRLNVIKPTDPESYYKSGEEVVIGTAAEQDKYTNENPGKKVKRIVTDNNGKVILVVSTQNQELETKHRLFTNSWRNIENFTRIFEGVNYLKNFRGEECIRPDEWEINPTGTDEAFFAIITAADWVTFPTNESGEGMNEIITNTYDEVYGAQQFIGEGFSVKIPDSWSGKYIVNTEKSDDGTSYSFIQKATHDKYGAGTLCIVERVSPETADELLNMLGGSELLYRGENYAYIYEIPTDVQYPVWADHDEEDVAIAAEYEEMFGQVDVIKNSFELTDNTETAPSVHQ